jgi:BirA family transcriptional regulator, biotin operon repressor / biotin---[acetyl-CoA-carboxylase] ligase
MNHYSSLKKLIVDDIEYHSFDSIESTSSFLTEIPYSKRTQLCIAREQTKGKGQHGRHWASQKDGSILFSLRKCFSENTNLNGLSLVIGMAIIKSIEAECQLRDLKIKWPNDVYFGNKKLAGILMENNIHKGNQYVVIGVGFNYQLDHKINIDTPWTDLSQIVKKLPGFDKLTASFIKNILAMSKDFELNGLSSLRPEWSNYDMLKGVKIRLKDSNEVIEGKVDGISEYGALRISSPDGVKEVYSSMHIEYI